jgi:hypothetical protein
MQRWMRVEDDGDFVFVSLDLLYVSLHGFCRVCRSAHAPVNPIGLLLHLEVCRV